MGSEREVKLDVDPDAPLPDLVGTAAAGGGTVTGLAKRTLDAEYFDTTDLRLTRWGCSLRHRSDEGWTVKLPDPGGDDAGVLLRTEVHFRGTRGAPPAGAVALVAPFSRGADLAPVARLHTVRTPVRVDDPDGRPVAEVVEDEVTVRSPGRARWSFHQVEIELADGRSARDVSAVVDRYASAGAHPTSVTKVARALGPGATAPPDVVVPPVSARPTAREVIHAAIARAVETHLRHLPIARVGEGTEGVHQARVALRRLRSDLRTFGPLLDPAWATGLSEEVRWLGDRLGDVRDADVRIDVLARVITEATAVDRREAELLVQRLRTERNQAHARLRRALDTRRCAALLDRLVDAAGDPRTAPQADDPASASIPALIDRPWRRLRKAVRRLGPAPTQRDLHRIRILAKRCRYSAEAVEPVLGKPARRLAKAMQRIQDSLGDLNDAITIRAHLERLADEHEELGYVAGELSGLLLARAGHCEADFRRQWREIRRLDLAATRRR